MENDKKKPEKSQGKQSTAETDVSYNRDAEDLKNSTTTSQGYATSSSSLGSGGGPTEERIEDTATPDFEK